MDPEHLCIARTRLELARFLRREGELDRVLVVCEAAWERLSMVTPKDRPPTALEFARVLRADSAAPDRIDALVRSAKADYEAAGNERGLEELRRCPDGR